MRTASVFALPQLRLLGRFHRQSAQHADVFPLFWAGSGLECSFTGGALRLLLEADYTLAEPWIAVEVNGAPLLRMPLRRGVNEVCLFQGTSGAAPKHIRLLKETQPISEDPAARLWVRSLCWDGGEFLPLPPPACRLEFIGDSLTSGEGTFGAREETEWASAWLSASRAFPHMVAKRLHADCRIISQSGWGLRSGWDNNPLHALPDWYERVCGPALSESSLGSQEAACFEDWRPDAIIVNLGTNDSGAMENPPWQGPNGASFSQPPTPEGFALLENAALDFLKLLRRRNPGAKLVWAYGMLGEPLRGCLSRAVARFCRETGEENAWYLPLPAVSEETMGSRLHPGPLCHREACGKIVDFLQTVCYLSDLN